MSLRFRKAKARAPPRDRERPWPSIKPRVNPAVSGTGPAITQ